MARCCERMCAACSVCEKAEWTEVEDLAGFRLGISGLLFLKSCYLDFSCAYCSTEERNKNVNI